MPRAMRSPYEWSVTAQYLVAAGGAGAGELGDRRAAVAPDRVHLEVSQEVTGLYGAREIGSQDLEHAGAAEETRSEGAPAPDIFGLAAFQDGVFDGRRAPGADDVKGDAGR